MVEEHQTLARRSSAAKPEDRLVHQRLPRLSRTVLRLRVQEAYFTYMLRQLRRAAASVDNLHTPQRFRKNECAQAALDEGIELQVIKPPETKDGFASDTQRHSDSTLWLAQPLAPAGQAVSRC
ncbi:hypothetical protein [Paraburkholderia graminis]|uniref:hypothetical protein n=1 Tax=Paraburkholderia graminis TaxID=60548 RepID=UPI00286A23B3|nr:hypothetical protein [Paraburkholderia graminis]